MEASWDNLERVPSLEALTWKVSAPSAEGTWNRGNRPGGRWGGAGC